MVLAFVLAGLAPATGWQEGWPARPAKAAAVFEIDMWPGEGRPDLVAGSAALVPRAEPHRDAPAAPVLHVEKGQALHFDETLHRTTLAGRLRAREDSHVAGRRLGPVSRLSRDDYYSDRVPTVSLPVPAGLVIDYLQSGAEGGCLVRVRGEVIDTDPCPDLVGDPPGFALESEPRTEWWVRVLIDGRPVGWLLVDGKKVRERGRTFAPRPSPALRMSPARLVGLVFQRGRVMKYPPLAVVTLVAAFVSLPAANGATSGPSAASGPGATSVPTVTSGLGAAQRVAPGDLWFGTISPTHTGRIHSGCKQFADPEEVVGKGPITRVAVYGTEFIHGIRLRYGSDGIGLSHGFTEPVSGLSWAEWDVPDGERITRVEGAIARDYVVWLRFVTDRGTEREFGKKRGRTFVVSDPGGGALRTISGWANHKRHPSLYRAVTSLTFQFGAPYFIKKIDFDEKALDLARLKAAPEQCASQDFTNETSVEQAASYTNTLTLAKETRVTFESAFGLRFTTEAWIEAGGKLVKGGGSMSFESSAEVRSGRSFSSSREERVSWSVPVRVPPHSRVVASSTWRKYPVSIPFTYTVAWYVGSKDNIKKEVKLPGLYEDVRVDDLKHDFKEVKLTGEPGSRGRE